MAAARKQGILDVAIAGAGVSGVYVGWRLLTGARPDGAAPPPRRVEIFECSERVGGRLLSVQPPGIPNTWCELGGMRYMSSQPLVRSLIENRLNLPTQPFPVDEPENLNYLRGKHVRNADLIKPGILPYDLSWSEKGQDPSSLLANAVDRLIPGVTQMPGYQLREFLATYTIDGRHVYDWGFWNLLARGMSHEAYELARVLSGYDTPMLNWNAADTISLNFDLAPGVTYSHLACGYQAVPTTLASEFEQAGGEIRLGHRLLSFTNGTLDDGTEGIILTIHTDDRQKPLVVQARALVLAMPRRSLELLEQSGPVLASSNEAVWAMIRSVTPIPLFKLCIAYDYPWWEAVGVTQGRTQTDLPIRQLYYWATAPAKGVDPANRKSVLLATYDDGENVDFWDGLAKPVGRPFNLVQDRYTKKQPGSQEWHDHTPPAAMVAEADRQLKEVHALPYAPPPYAAAYIDWGIDPFGGGVNFWNVHVQSQQVIPRMVHPVEKVPVYICGEAYSNGQGWVEGALETAEMVLQEHMGLVAPEWVTPS
jgi:monoamine oxidase